MNITIKKVETDDEIRGTGYVHWKAWQEAYKGLVEQSYLDKLTLEKCIQTAFRRSDHILVAKDGEKVIGFAAQGAYRGDTMPDTGEVFALYILSDYYGKKVGYSLMCAALEQIAQYNQVALWVLKGNERAIRFYQKCGFRFDGTEQTITLDIDKTKLRMVLVKSMSGL